MRSLPENRVSIGEGTEMLFISVTLGGKQ